MRSLILAVIGAAAISAPAFASIDDVRAAYRADAFSFATDNWRRITANRNTDCAGVSSSSQRRVDILIERYDALGDALSSGDAAAAEAAARSLNQTVSNPLFARCWDEISRRAGVGRDLARALRAV